MFVAIVAHFGLALLLPLVVRRFGRAAFALAALLPAATLAWALTAAVRAPGGEPPTETVNWASTLGLDLVLRLDAIALVMIVLVSGIGAAALLYYAAYAAYEHEGIGRNAVLLVVFAGAMLGLVLADDIFGLYVFWELTTLCSFLLIGGSGVGRAERRAALQALLVTVLGGLAMLLGLIILSDAAGTFRISEIVADPPSGPAAEVALVLVLLGAFTKSAQLPFHPWLPAAMVAPTPISAYLHAAAMVKAGVYLVARLAPGFSEHAVWPAVIAVGLLTMLVGAARALVAHDLKRMLAHGTVSQLGFMMVLFGAGTPKAAAAGYVLLLAHGLFKVALFFAAGAVDKAAGSREVTELSGLGRRWPVLTALTALAAASMAGLPPLLGFVAKEAGFDAFVSGSAVGIVVLAGIVIGSLLTVAYSARFLWGAFASKPDVEPVSSPPPWPFAVAIGVPAIAGLVLGPGVSWLQAPATRYVQAIGEPIELKLWHGPGLPLLLSTLVLVGGYVLHRVVPRDAPIDLPFWLDAQRAYEGTVHGLDVAARRVTGRTQAGSLPIYLAVILLTFLLVPGGALLLGGELPTDLRAWDSGLQLPLAVLVVIAVVGTLAARRRLTAVLLLGAVGYLVGALFLVQGAPDLALAQVLVESLTLIVFVFVLRRFPATFGKQRGARTAAKVRAVIAIGAGCFVALSALVLSGLRTASPDMSQQYLDRAEDETGASNVVTAILVDFRALDTIGEVAVLAVAVTGAASLILTSHRRGRRIDALPERTPERQYALPLTVTTRAVFPTVMLLSVYLLFAGHEHLGGGFPAGLVAGLGFVLRYVAGGPAELSAAVRIRPLTLVGIGLSLMTLAAVVPLAFGEPVLTSAVMTQAVPVLGELKLASNMLIDIGVYLLVVGAVLDLLRTLGAWLQSSERRPVVETSERA